MDCNSARLFLNFYRPPAGDLSGPEAEELEQHLAVCSECNALASAEHRLDQHLGRAMRAVEVPPALRRNIMNALATQRSAWNRRWVRHASRVAVAAVLLLAVSLGGYFWSAYRTRDIDLQDVRNALCVTPPDRDSVNAALKRLGESAVAPSFVNYNYLTASPSLAELPGYKGDKVPQLVFTQKDPAERDFGAVAVVFVLDKRRFHIDDEEISSNGYKFLIDVQPGEHDRVNYVILYTGKSWDWLRQPEAAE